MPQSSTPQAHSATPLLLLLLLLRLRRPRRQRLLLPKSMTLPTQWICFLNWAMMTERMIQSHRRLSLEEMTADSNPPTNPNLMQNWGTTANHRLTINPQEITASHQPTISRRKLENSAS